MKKIILSIVLLTSFAINAQGLNFSSKDQILKYDKFDFESKGYATSLPQSYSLEKYVPPILVQQGGTCVGFASIYYGLSTIYNKKLNITSELEKYAFSFDPYFLYTLINKSANCEDGLNYVEAFDLLQKLGAKKIFYPSFLDCNSKIEEAQLKRVAKYTSPYKIKNAYVLEPEDKSFIMEVKEVIHEGIPVFVGIEVTKSFEPFNSKTNINGVKKDGLWKVNLKEKSIEGHAMCVIGYDNVKFGGCFKLANSWDTTYGENGFLYIKYTDFKKIVKECYFIEIDENEFLNSPNYQRISFSEPEYKNHNYEGEVNGDSFNGFGIYSVDHEYFMIGEFINGDKNGTFICIDKNADKYHKITVYEFKDDIIVKKINGFATDTSNKSIEGFKNYLGKIIPDMKVENSDIFPDIDLKTKK